MAGACLVEFLAGAFQAGAQKLQFGAVLFGQGDPVVELARRWWLATQAVYAKGGDVGKGFTDQVLETAAGDFPLLAGFQREGCVQVEAGLRFVDVGADAGAGRKRLFGGFELTGVGLGLGPDEGDLVVGEQQVEIGFGEAGDELLSGVGEIRFGFHGLGAGLAQGGPLDRLEQGLADGDRASAAVVVPRFLPWTVGDGGVGFEFVEVAAQADADLGEQLGARDGDGFGAGFGAGPGGAQDGVVGEGGVPGFVEVKPARCRGVGGRGGKREHAAGQQHGQFAGKERRHAGHSHSSFIEADRRLTSGCSR